VNAFLSNESRSVVAFCYLPPPLPSSNFLIREHLPIKVEIDWAVVRALDLVPDASILAHGSDQVSRACDNINSAAVIIDASPRDLAPTCVLPPMRMKVSESVNHLRFLVELEKPLA